MGGGSEHRESRPKNAHTPRFPEYTCWQHGDAEINFAHEAVKVNRKFKAQFQCIVVTDKNVYKYVPGKYKVTSHPPLIAATPLT